MCVANREVLCHKRVSWFLCAKCFCTFWFHYFQRQIKKCLCLRKDLTWLLGSIDTGWNWLPKSINIKWNQEYFTRQEQFIQSISWWKDGKHLFDFLIRVKNESFWLNELHAAGTWFYQVTLGTHYHFNTNTSSVVLHPNLQNGVYHILVVSSNLKTYFNKFPCNS